jgi:hypothetical protein
MSYRKEDVKFCFEPLFQMQILKHQALASINKMLAKERCGVANLVDLIPMSSVAEDKYLFLYTPPSAAESHSLANAY